MSFVHFIKNYANNYYLIIITLDNVIAKYYIILRTRIKPKKERISILCDKIKMNVDELINKLQNTLNNKLINENDLNVKTTELSNELLETIKIIENCTSCKDKIEAYDIGEE